MKIKSTINFKTLREKGPSSLNIKNDEVIQIKAKNEILCVITQEHLLQLMGSNLELIACGFAGLDKRVKKLEDSKDE